MLSARAVALHGIGFSTLLVAKQGFGEIETPVNLWDTSQGMAGKRNTGYYNRLHRDDELVTDLIVALVTQGFFDGHAQGLSCSS